jgi:hypothetical protein
MKFLCLCYYEQKKFDALSKTDLEALGQASKPHDEALRNSGRLIVQGSLADPPASKTVRPGTGKPSIAAGPYAETKEPVGAFFIVEAADLDEAVEVAAKHPGAHVGQFLGGGIEVRPRDMFEQS